MTATPVRPAHTLLAAAVSSIVCSIATAQTVPVQHGGDDTGLAMPEVVVTAQRTESLASRTPLAISVLSGEQLRDLGADSPGTIGPRLPNVYIDQAFSGLRLTIRGISNSDTTDKGDPSAAFMLDGLPPRAATFWTSTASKYCVARRARCTAATRPPAWST
jgi:iron complex outermembrane receptor protein